jgi:hypothetical protein
VTQLPESLRASLVLMGSKIRHYDNLHAFYSGDHKEQFASDKIKELLRDTGFYHANFLASVVDCVAERLDVTGITCADSKARDLLQQFWDDSEFDQEVPELITSALEYGDSYVIVGPDETTSGLSAYIHSPQTVRVFYNPEFPRRKAYAIHTTTIIGDEYNKLPINREFFQVTVYYPDIVQVYRSEEIAIGFSLDYNSIDLQLVDEFPSLVPGQIPVYHFRNGRPYGTSRLTPGIPIQIQYNTVLTGMMSAISYSSYPQRYCFSDAAQRTGDNFAAPNDDGTDDNDYTSGPGNTWLLSGVTGVGQFPAADSRNFLEPLATLKDDLARVTDTPSSYFHDTATPMSGLAYKRSESALIKVCERLQASYGSAFKEMFAYVLAFNNITVDAEVAWHPIEVVDDKEYWDSQVLKASLGVPHTVLLQESGLYTEEIVSQWQADAAAKNASANPPPNIPPAIGAANATQGKNSTGA